MRYDSADKSGNDGDKVRVNLFNANVTNTEVKTDSILSVSGL